MYQDFFGLREAPFSIAPNPHYLYMSKQHHEALAHLVYGVGRDGGFVLLTGEVGTGKTTICRCFLEQVPEDTDVAFILNPKLNAEQLLASLCDELGIDYLDSQVSIKTLVDAINDYLLRSHSKGRHTVLIIDEAQNLSAEVLEQLRLLTNLETNEKKLLQIVLLGQPELQAMFQRPDLRQLAQRITARFHLRELQLNEIGPYVRHRLGVAGGRDIIGIFPDKTLRRLFTLTAGVPRLINLICDRAMLGAYAQNSRVVDVRTLESAAREIMGPSFPAGFMAPYWARVGSAKSLALIITVALVVGLLWSMQGLRIDVAISPQNAPAQEASQDSPVLAEVDALLPEDDVLSSEADVLAPEADGESENTTSDPAAALEALIQQGDPVKDEAAAYQFLYSLWQVNLPANVKACQPPRREGMQCLTRAGSLGLLRHFGLPAVVTLYSASGEKTHAVLSRLDSRTVVLRMSEQELSLDEQAFNQHWRGHFTVLWKAPPVYAGPLLPGAVSPLTGWLRTAFSHLDNQPPSGDGATYDEALVARVRAFQRDMGETDDGIVGDITMMLLTQRLGDAIPSLLPVASPGVEGAP